MNPETLTDTALAALYKSAGDEIARRRRAAIVECLGLYDDLAAAGYADDSGIGLKGQIERLGELM